MTTEPTRPRIEEPESFYEFVPDGFRAFNPDGNYYREHTSDGDVFQDAETQQTYDTLNDLQLAQGGYPERWGGESVQLDDDGDGYIRVDDERLDLDPDGQGGFTARYLSYELGESPDGDAGLDQHPDRSRLPHQAGTRRRTQHRQPPRRLRTALRGQRLHLLR